MSHEKLCPLMNDFEVCTKDDCQWWTTYYKATPDGFEETHGCAINALVENVDQVARGLNGKSD